MGIMIWGNNNHGRNNNDGKLKTYLEQPRHLPRLIHLRLYLDVSKCSGLLRFGLQQFKEYRWMIKFKCSTATYNSLDDLGCMRVQVRTSDMGVAPNDIQLVT
ncbi:hypothetical protein SADUNF_Sadunf07G0027400 [Salix dunnii]|uniref:Uncharacterized protein n=1 Tax=Salix dunnii TaxID=1413687 RepID=A0A835MUY0_9ROSI|nr:hypothetical protein SADUNF_Sadunf07G0027400 [Salix dunnii]